MKTVHQIACHAALYHHERSSSYRVMAVISRYFTQSSIFRSKLC